jgi:hypothetical protein
MVALEPTLKKIRAPYNAQNSEDIKAWMDAVSTAGDAGTLAGNALSADAPGRAVMQTGYFTEAKATDAFAAAAISAALLKPSQIDGTQVKVGAAANTIGIISEEFIIAVTDGSTVQTGQTLNATYGKIIVDDVYFVKGPTTGGTTDAVQLFADAGGSTSPVSSSLALNTIAEGGVVRTTSLLNTAFNAGAIFYVKRTSTTNNAGTLYIKAHRVA